MSITESFSRFLIDSQIQYESGGDSILFDWDSLKYILVISMDDPTYFRLMLPHVATINSENEARLDKISIDLGTRYKVGKVIRFEQSLWLSFEAFVYQTDGNNAKFYVRAMKTLKQMWADLLKEVNTSQPSE